MLAPGGFPPFPQAAGCALKSLRLWKAWKAAHNAASAADLKPGRACRAQAVRASPGRFPALRCGRPAPRSARCLPRVGIAPRCALAALRRTVRWTVRLRSARAAVPRRDGSLWVAVRRLPGSRALSAARSFDGSGDLAITARAGRRSRSTAILPVDARCANVITNRPSAGLRSHSILAGLRPAPAARTSARLSARGFRSGKGRTSAPLRDVAPGPSA